jgi:hypothetical protein
MGVAKVILENRGYQGQLTAFLVFLVFLVVFVTRIRVGDHISFNLFRPLGPHIEGRVRVNWPMVRNVKP